MFESIQRWFKKTFPKASFASQIQKLKTEIEEFQEAESDYASNPTSLNYLHYQEELADVVISAINLASFAEMQELVKEKMKINRSRTFDGDHHI